jgi:hypothetical protein
MGGLAKEYSAQALPAAQGLFDQFDAFNGAFTLGSEFAAAERLTQLFEARVVLAAHAAQFGVNLPAAARFRVLLHAFCPRSG